MLVLDTHNTTTPVSSESSVVVELSSEGLGKSLKILVVFLLHVGESNAGSGFLVDELADSCLTLYEAEGDTLLSAKLGEEHHHLKGVDIMSDDNEFSSVGFNEFGNVVKSEFQDNRLRSLLLFTLVNLGLSLLLESSFLLLFGLW